MPPSAPSAHNSARDVPGVGPLAALPSPAASSEANQPVEQAQVIEPPTQDAPTGQPVVANPFSSVPEPARIDKTEPVPAPRFHIVRPGETLSGIAQQYYDSKESWRKILAANNKTLKDANKLTPGMKLVIP